MKSSLLAPGILFSAIAGFSIAGPLTRYSQLDPVVLAVWRLGFTLPLVLIPAVWTQQWKEWQKLDFGEWVLGFFGGVLLALHFALWHASLRYTTVAASTTLVNMQPIVVLALSALFLHESVSRRQFLGMGMAIFGAILIARSDSKSSAITLTNTAMGNGLALLAAVACAGYYVVGRRLRAVCSIWSYTGIVYTVAFLALVVISICRASTLVPDQEIGRESGIACLLAFGPMLLGHTGLNWALRYFRAPVVNMVTLGEPVGASILAAFLPGIREVPGTLTICGGAVVLLGIGTGLYKSAPPHQSKT